MFTNFFVDIFSNKPQIQYQAIKDCSLISKNEPKLEHNIAVDKQLKAVPIRSQVSDMFTSLKMI